MDNTRWNEVYSSGNVAWGNYTSTFLKEVIHLFPKGCKVLDLGCGNGRNLQYLIDNGYDAVGYDFSHVAISQGLTTKIKHKDLIKEQWNIGKFDVVIDRCSSTHSSPKTVENFYAKMTRHLNPGSKLYWQGFADDHSAKNFGHQQEDGAWNDFSDHIFIKLG